jgi:hypothetical protein
VAGKTGGNKKSLRPDTTLAPIGELGAEVYVRGLPACCLAAFKEAVVRGIDDEQLLLELRCQCGQGWHVTSSLDNRVLGRFVTHGEPRVAGDTYPAA